MNTASAVQIESPETAKIKSRAGIIFMALSVAATSYLIYVLYRYLTLGIYMDHAEPEIAILAWRLVSGAGLYGAPEAATNLVTGYGPLVYLISAGFLGLFEPSIAVSKIAAMAALLGALALFTVYVWRRFGAAYVGIGGLAFVCYPLIVSPISFWVRPEAFSVLLVTIALVSTLADDRGQPWLTAIVVAACAGLAMNLKVHCFIYFVPIVLRYCVVGWPLKWPMMAIVSIAFFALPFSLPSISASNYLAMIQSLVSDREIEPAAVRSAIKFSQFFVAPGVLLGFAALANRSGLKKPDVLYFVGFLAALTINLYPSSVAGSSWYHMLPFFPITVDLFLRYLRAIEAKPGAWLSGMVVVALAVTVATVTPQKRLLRAFSSISLGPILAAEVEKFIADNPGKSIQMGYPSDDQVFYRWTFVRPLLTFAGNPTTISGATSMERQFRNIPPQQAKIDWIRQCRTDLWLIPRQTPLGQPFFMSSYLGGKAFHESIQETFLESYVRAGVTEHYEFWKCGNLQPSPNSTNK